MMSRYGHAAVGSLPRSCAKQCSTTLGKLLAVGHRIPDQNLAHFILQENSRVRTLTQKWVTAGHLLEAAVSQDQRRALHLMPLATPLHTQALVVASSWDHTAAQAACTCPCQFAI